MEAMLGRHAVATHGASCHRASSRSCRCASMIGLPGQIRVISRDGRWRLLQRR
jgi:hypothetical protein